VGSSGFGGRSRAIASGRLFRNVRLPQSSILGSINQVNCSFTQFWPKDPIRRPKTALPSATAATFCSADHGATPPETGVSQILRDEAGGVCSPVRWLFHHFPPGASSSWPAAVVTAKKLGGRPSEPNAAQDFSWAPANLPVGWNIRSIGGSEPCCREGWTGRFQAWTASRSKARLRPLESGEMAQPAGGRRGRQGHAASPGMGALRFGEETGCQAPRKAGAFGRGRMRKNIGRWARV